MTPKHARGDLDFPTWALLCALRSAGGEQWRGPSNLPQFAPRPPKHARSDHAIPTTALSYAIRRTR